MKGGDRSLARRDTALPGLGLVLDDDAFAAALAAAIPGAGVRGSRATYVRYKPQTSCLVAHRLRLAGGAEAEVYARAQRAGATDKLETALRDAGRASTLGPGGVVLDAHAVAVHAFPHDRRLRQVRRLVSARRRAALLRAVLPGRPELHDARATTLGYRPERRWVARLDGVGDARALLKAHGEDRFDAVLRTSTALTEAMAASGEPPVAARMLGHDPAARVIVFEWLDGRSLEALALDGARLAGAAVAAGAALARLHHLTAPGLPDRPAHELSERLDDAARAIGALLPGVAERVEVLAGRLAVAAGDGGPRCATHGDCSMDQVICGPRRAHLVDLDSAAVDAPVADVAAFLSDLEARTLRGRLEPAVAERLGRGFCEGYAAAGGPAPTAGPEVGRRAAAALLLRATEPFRQRDRRWPAGVEALVTRAEALAAGARHPLSERAPVGV